MVFADKNRAWEDDSELGFDLNGSEQYVKALKKLSDISSGLFLPLNMAEKWNSSQGPIYVSYTCNGKVYEFEPEFLDDYLDIEAVVDSANEALQLSGYRFDQADTGDQTFRITFMKPGERIMLPEKQISKDEGTVAQKEGVPVIILQSKLHGKWEEDPDLAKNLVQKALRGDYGFVPKIITFGEDAYPISSYSDDLWDKMEKKEVKQLKLFQEYGNITPSFIFVISVLPKPIVTIEFPYDPDKIDASFIDVIINISKQLIHDTLPIYFIANTHLLLKEERQKNRIVNTFLPISRNWLTYLCKEYVESCGGKDYLQSAPAFKSMSLGEGILLQSHSSFLDFESEAYKKELNDLWYYLVKNLNDGWPKVN